MADTDETRRDPLGADADEASAAPETPDEHDPPADDDAAAAPAPAGDPPVEATPVPLDDPEGLAAARECPLCDGAGTIPYGLKQSPRYQRCPDCGGIGEVLTGSLNGDGAVTQCERCTGSGFCSTLDTPPVAQWADALSPPTDAPPWPGAVFDQAVGVWR